MAKQKFTAIERQAIWAAHTKKCAYTGAYIDVRNMHIDHIIPESIFDDWKAFLKLKTKLNLSEDFNIKGYENLLPCSQSANLLKNKIIFDEAKTQYFLGIASSKKKIIESYIVKITYQDEKAKAAIILQRLLES